MTYSLYRLRIKEVLRQCHHLCDGFGIPLLILRDGISAPERIAEGFPGADRRLDVGPTFGILLEYLPCIPIIMPVSNVLPDPPFVPPTIRIIAHHYSIRFILGQYKNGVKYTRFWYYRVAGR
jgi:hypothetical protein